jgi:tetratricopeptide (TPR) repeat protein
MSEAPQSCNGSLEDRVAEVVDAFMGEVHAGGRPDVEEYTRRHPEMASVLRQVLPALGVLGPAESGEGARDGGVPGRGCLGDYRLLREVGRGGMGVVYEAEQVSLGRRVALKALPFAATMDPRHLQRFHNEARAAACLDHPHVVKVHAVGSDRGVHYYAMQFIDGVTLAEIIARQQRPAPTQAGGPASAARGEPTTAYAPGPGPQARTADGASSATQPAPRDRAYYRRVAEWGIQAAEALEHAHGLGIVHRDVKPANLMLDAHGKLWVTDFGLARTAADSGLTLTGDLLGTLRYMSPEQALARHGLVDHRTDVYSLGATLYELLTLEPAFPGHDRAELLRQIAFEDPRPPRRLNRAVPAELETVVLKAMEKDPNARYATAKELAEDLRRWLDDRPIRARRPTLGQRLRRWARRHRAAVGAALAVLVVAALAVAGSVGWAARDRAARRQAAERAAAELLDGAWQACEGGRWQEAATAVRKAEALLEGSTSAGLRQRLRELQDDLAMRQTLLEARLLSAGGASDGLHLDVWKSDAAYARAFADYGIDVMGLDPRQAGARVRARAIRLELVAALEDWAAERWSARGVQEGSWKHVLAAAGAADPDPRRDRVRAALLRGDRAGLERLAASQGIEQLPPSTLQLLAKGLQAHGARERAIGLLRAAQRRHPDDFWANFDLAYALQHLAHPRLEEAARFYTAARALLPSSAAPVINLGHALLGRGQPDEALACFQEAIRLEPDDVVAHNNLGVALRRKGRLDEAITSYREALRLKPDYAEARSNLARALRDKGLLDEAIAEYRKVVRLKPGDAEAHASLGLALRPKGRLDEAIAEYREALRLKPDYAEAHVNLGNALRDQGKLDEAIAEHREALRHKPDLAEAHKNLGVALRDKGRLDEAIAEHREAIRLKPDYVEARSNLGLALLERGRPDEAIAALREAVRLKPDHAEAHSNLGAILAMRGRPDEAIAALREALRLKPDCVEAHVNLGIRLAGQGKLAEAIACYREALRHKPDLAGALNNLAWLLATAPEAKYRDAPRAVELARRAVKRDPRKGNPWGTLGVACYRNGDWKAAAEALSRSTRLNPTGHASHFFFLAMAHWRLGEKGQARTWYDRGVAWMEKNSPKDEELKRFRAEAEGLLGIKNAQPATERQATKP